MKAPQRQQAELEDDEAKPFPAKRVQLSVSLEEVSSDEESRSDHDELEPDTFYDNIEEEEKEEQEEEKENEEDEEFIGAKLSKKILKAARRQQAELGNDEAEPPAKRVQLSDSLEEGSSDEESGSDHDELEPDTFYDSIEEEEEGEDEEEKENEEDEQAENTWNLRPRITKKHSALTLFANAQTLQRKRRPKASYKAVGEALQKYRSGSVPKAFKMIPHLKYWENILYIYKPSTWTAASIYKVTEIFALKLKEEMAQRFYRRVLLPRVRAAAAAGAALDPLLQQALRVAISTPGAFIKEIVLPLLKAEDCTLREALSVGAALAHAPVPAADAGAALLTFAEMDYTGPHSILLRILIDKNHALPHKVIDALVLHFLRFKRDSRDLAVLWHRALHIFVQTYKADISTEQRDALLQLLRRQGMPELSQEIRRELQAAKCRAVAVEDLPTDIATN